MGSNHLSLSETKKQQSRHLMAFFPLSALLHPGVDIFLCLSVVSVPQKGVNFTAKVTIQKQGFIDNLLSTVKGWLVICSTWNKSKTSSQHCKKKCIYLKSRDTWCETSEATCWHRNKYKSWAAKSTSSRPPRYSALTSP